MVKAPRVIFWELTKKCNLKCRYCRVQTEKIAPELDTKEALGLVRDIGQDFKDALLILSGGEPFLRQDLFSILSQAFSLGVKTCLATNATLLGEIEAKLLKIFQISRVSISLDSIEESRHDASRGVAGSFRAALNSISILKKNSIPFQINFTITRENKEQILSLANFALSLGAQEVHYFILVPVGCGKQVEQGQGLDSEDTDRVLQTIRMASQNLRIGIRPTCAPQYIRFMEQDRHPDCPYSPGSFRALLRRIILRSQRRMYSGEGGCLAGNRVFFVSSEGDIYPCGYLPLKAGSVREASPVDIWRNSLLLRQLRQDSLKGSCSVCEFKDRCRGCRARAYSVRGDYMAQDDSCSLSKKLKAACTSVT
jgi:radical SAM protein with 4Fe4S-binding SPASM domain